MPDEPCISVPLSLGFPVLPLIEIVTVALLILLIVPPLLPPGALGPPSSFVPPPVCV